MIESGKAKALEPMAAADRKVVHDTCNEIDGVSTISEGEDPRRRVVIEPADLTPPEMTATDELDAVLTRRSGPGIHRSRVDRVPSPAR